MDNSRREHLKQYILACVRDSVLSWSDLTSPAVFDKFLKILSKDTKSVFAELGRVGGSGLMRFVGAKLADLAEDVVVRRRKGV